MVRIEMYHPMMIILSFDDNYLIIRWWSRSFSHHKLQTEADGASCRAVVRLHVSFCIIVSLYHCIITIWPKPFIIPSLVWQKANFQISKQQRQMSWRCQSKLESLSAVDTFALTNNIPGSHQLITGQKWNDFLRFPSHGAIGWSSQIFRSW